MTTKLSVVLYVCSPVCTQFLVRLGYFSAVFTLSVCVIWSQGPHRLPSCCVHYSSKAVRLNSAKKVCRNKPFVLLSLCLRLQHRKQIYLNNVLKYLENCFVNICSFLVSLVFCVHFGLYGRYCLLSHSLGRKEQQSWRYFSMQHAEVYPYI